MYQKPLKCARSNQSTRSLKSTIETYIEEHLDLTTMIVEALKQYQCPIDIIVNKISEKPVKKLHPLKSESKRSSTTNIDIDIATEETNTGNTLTIDTFYDTHDHLVAISISKYKYQAIPRMVIQVLGLITQKCSKLTKMIIKDSFADRYTILEIKNILAISTTITDICLDSSFLHEGNYDVLLSQITSLRNLSLKSCNINDEVCHKIAQRLHFLQPAEIILLTLNLSSNWITDSGVASIGEALRSNRHLRYLNLSDNRITDYGARQLFDVLKEFCLTPDEIVNKRSMFCQYLKNKTTLYNKCIMEFESKTTDNISTVKKSGRKSVSKNKDSKNVERQLSPCNENVANNKIDLIVSNLVGTYNHPFNKSQVIVKDGYSHCKGNFVLSYLNLAYNDLTYTSIQKLLEVLEYQQKHKGKDMPGLMKVVIEGNNLPINCDELKLICNILMESKPNVFTGKHFATAAKKK